MTLLSPLLDVQELDLASDELVRKRAALPERAALTRSRQGAVELDGLHERLLTQRTQLGEQENALAAEVDAAARRAKEVEDTLYGGTVKAAKELETLQTEVAHLRDQQSEVESRQMEVLEEIDQVETSIAENRDQRGERDREAEGLIEALGAAEVVIDGELAALATQREGRRRGLPEPVLQEYERLRQKERLAGRAAAPLEAGVCGGCRIKLPVVEYNRMQGEPEEALLCCSHCGRVLVRV